MIAYTLIGLVCSLAILGFAVCVEVVAVYLRRGPSTTSSTTGRGTLTRSVR